MLDRYIDLINSPSKEINNQFDDSSLGTSIDNSMYSDSDSQSDFYSTFMSKYRKKIRKLMSSSPLDDDSSNLDTESNLSESFNYDSNSTTFVYSKPQINKSYQSPKSINKQIINLNQTVSPTTRKYKTKINFNNQNIIENRNKIKPTLHRHTRKHSDRKRRRKMKDFLSFDPVFNKYFYQKDKIESDNYSDYSYYEDDYNDQEVDDYHQYQNNDDTISDFNSVAQDEDVDFQWVETGKVAFRKPQQNSKKANIWEPNLASPTLKQLKNESKSKKRKI